nr:MAG: Px protein [Sobemovirus sp.]
MGAKWYQCLRLKPFAKTISPATKSHRLTEATVQQRKEEFSPSPHSVYNVFQRVVQHHAHYVDPNWVCSDCLSACKPYGSGIGLDCRLRYCALADRACRDLWLAMETRGGQRRKGDRTQCLVA